MDHDTAKWQRLCKSDPENLEFQRAAIKARARVDGPRVLLEPLVNHQFWAEVADWRRELTLEAVTQLLGDSYQFLGLHDFHCADQTHSIAQFQHKGSDLIVHLIPGGRYTMGSDDFAQEQPTHTVDIAPFLLGQFSVTQSQWDRLGGEDSRAFQGADLPIETVSWHDAEEWLGRLGSEFRFPSESEWEYACRANTETDFFWGENYFSETMERFKDHSFAWFETNSQTRPHPMSEHLDRVNAFGLIDMVGNVFEWCGDCWIDQYETGPKSEKIRHRSRDSSKVLRGGSWRSSAADLRSANRARCEPWQRRGEAGLRVALDVPGWKENDG